MAFHFLPSTSIVQFKLGPKVTRSLHLLSLDKTVAWPKEGYRQGHFLQAPREDTSGKSTLIAQGWAHKIFKCTILILPKGGSIDSPLSPRSEEKKP